MRVGNDGVLTYAYNAQAATSEDGLILAVDVTTTVPGSPLRTETIMGKPFDPANPAAWTERAVRA